MREKKEIKKPTHHNIGFIACYYGKEIASAERFDQLMNRANVKALLGNKDLIIKHNVPEDLIAVYYYITMS